MEIQELVVQKRWDTGKGVARKLRASGFIPGICYRKDFDPIPLSLEKKVFEKLLQSTSGQNLLMKLTIRDDRGTSDDNQTVILKDMQKNHMSDLIHVDFLAVLLTETITVEAALRFVGEPAEALRAGGLVQQLKRSLDIECLPTNIPDFIDVDISELNIGDALHVENITIPEGVRVLSDLKEPVVIISAPTEEKEEGAKEAEGEEAAEEGKDKEKGKEE